MFLRKTPRRISKLPAPVPRRASEPHVAWPPYCHRQVGLGRHHLTGRVTQHSPPYRITSPGLHPLVAPAAVKTSTRVSFSHQTGSSPGAFSFWSISQSVRSVTPDLWNPGPPSIHPSIVKNAKASPKSSLTSICRVSNKDLFNHSRDRTPTQSPRTEVVRSFRCRNGADGFGVRKRKSF